MPVLRVRQGAGRMAILPCLCRRFGLCLCLRLSVIGKRRLAAGQQLRGVLDHAGVAFFFAFLITTAHSSAR
jgi:hypothetical protein